MTVTPFDGAPTGTPASLAPFNRWLLRAGSGERIEYHRGHLIWDRSPASGFSEDDRRALARVANAALKAAEDGLVHLAQRRNGPFDFSYLAIKRPILKAISPDGFVAEAGQPEHMAAAA